MKRRQRRQVLDINGEQSDSPRRNWQNKYEEIATDQSDLNGGPSNPLTNLLEQYNSDSEAEESKSDGKQLDDKVNDFLKEIQLIAPEVPTVEIAAKKPNSDVKECHKAQACALSNESSTLWQECFDDSTGYPYYWHVQTNEVTWEVPEEIRLLRERNQQDSLNRTSYSTQWVNFSANTYPQPQINIPEGMIPKEVVARNRNRQVSLQQNSQRVAQAEQNTSKDLVTKDDESDDGKIEMITSFGSDGSESETSENDSPMKKSSKSSESTSRTRTAEKTASQSPRGSLMAVKKTEIGEKSGKIGPSLPAGIVPLVHGPENSSTNEADREKWRRKDIDKVSKDEQHSPKLEQKFDLSLRNTSENVYGSTKLIAESKGKDDEREAGVNSVKELKFSLVPGYADDSDVEDDATPKKLNVVEPLFPIADYPDNSTATIVGQDGIVKKVEMKYTDSGSVRIFQYHSTSNDKLESTSNEVKQMNEELEAEVQETLNVEETRVVRVEDEPPKPNIFLENLETAPKAFQRKRRIAFDAVTHPSIGGLSQRCLTWEIAEAAYQPRVHYTPSALLFIYCPDIQVILNKSRMPEAEAVNKPETSPSPPTTCLGNETDRQGLGVPKESRNEENENSADSWDGKTNSPITEKPTAPGNKAAISFTKGETIVTKTKETVIVKEKTEEEINALKTVTETIMEKLRFLSEGGQSASAVQVMAIQLQTLLAAWEACELKDNYLENWLTGTGRELGRLEEAAAPPGWDCQWDRSHKRYFYRNSTTGDAQWTYPETDVIGGTEEMELCTTPPPQGQEEPCIIESQTEKVQEIPSSVESEPLNEETSDAKKLNNERKDVTAPPPPQISSPSPPPPPRIYAEDMKKGKKRRGSIQGTIPETKRDKCSAETNGDERSKESINPPLPPSPNKSNQPPLPPHPPSVPNPPSSEPLPPGVDPPDMPFTINAPSIGTTMLYTPAGPQTNPIYAATIGDPAILGHHTALMQGQLMHYPTYHQHLHNQALIAAANRLTGQEAVQFMVDYSQVYANTQVIAKPPTKSHKETLGSAIDSFYSDIATIENIRNDHETDQMLPIEPVPVILPQIPLEVEQPPVLTDSVLKERKKKKTKLGISKKQKEVSSMVAKWQKAQSYEDND